MSITLSQLLMDKVSIPAELDCAIQNIRVDSRQVQQGDLFIAYKGAQLDGRKFIQEAFARGAHAVLCDAEDFNIIVRSDDKSKKPIVYLPELQKWVGKIAARFFSDPSADMTVIGVTGTNGKTSCTQFIARALEMVGRKCGIIGTLGAGFPDHLHVLGLTTPDAITLQSELKQLQEQDATAVAMEVSSHSLAQYRVDGIHFTVAIFTNLTRDHLDYHGNMLNYAHAKKRLFEQPGLRYAVINLDDEYGLEYLAQLPPSVCAYGYTLKNVQVGIPTVAAETIELSEKGCSAYLKTPWGEGKLTSNLLGRFNLSNLLAVLTALNILDVPFNKSLEVLATLKTVPGRLQMFGGEKQPIVAVDYAHTPDALEKVLKALREHCKGELWCIFGCGGERDRGKRPIMAEVAERCSDKVIVTDDNPRREYSQKIIEDIMQGFLYPHRVNVIADRRAAITYAIEQAKPQDVILVAGKGHETYQIIGEEKFSFSDADEVQANLNLLISKKEKVANN